MDVSSISKVFFFTGNIHSVYLKYTLCILLIYTVYINKPANTLYFNIPKFAREENIKHNMLIIQNCIL